MSLLRKWASKVIAISIVLLSGTAAAKTITLELKSGGFNITGELVHFDGQKYVIQSEKFGIIQVDTNKFQCIAGECPVSNSFTSSVTNYPSGGKVKIVGSSTLGAKLVPALIRDYATSIDADLRIMRENTNEFVTELVDKSGNVLLTFDLQRGQTSTAFSALASSKADIGISERPISDGEIGILTQAGQTDIIKPGSENVIGQDGIIVVTSQKTNVRSLSIEAIAQIFSGDIQNWVEVGFPSAKINVYVTDEQSESFKTFRSLVMKPYKKVVTPAAKRFHSNKELAEAVANDPNGIGIASFSEIELVRAIEIKDTCGTTYKPSKFSVRTNEYPLSRNLYFYMKSPISVQARAFLDFTLSSASSPALEEAGFIDKKISTLPFSTFHDNVVNTIVIKRPEEFDFALFREMLTTLENGSRLSVAMHFEVNSSKLVSESSRLLSKVAAYLRKQDLKKNKILIVGYSDTTGSFTSNKSLALNRAETVRKALLLKSDFTIKSGNFDVRAYGELFPVACNDTENGRNKNRRVEIWLVPSTIAAPAVLSKQL